MAEGSNHTFSVAASGDGPLSYQWRRDSVNLVNQTNAALPLTSIQTNDAGIYTVVVTNVSGAITSAPARLTVRLVNDPAYPVPQGGWAYLYNGIGIAAPLAAALDGTWNHENDSWVGDGRGAGDGTAGGLSSTNGILTIEDAVSTSATGFNNRRYNFSHDLAADPGVTNASTLLNDGVTLTFRARLTPASDPLIEIPNAPNGSVNNSDGKGMFGLRQAGGSGLLISFSLNQAIEDTTTSGTFNFGQAGLHMNNLNGNVRSAVVDPGETGTLNVLPLNPAVFHEFWITLQDNAADPGTHRVSIYLDGSKVPTVFNVTAGSGVDGPFSNYLLLGLGNSSLQRGAVDVDFIGYRPGVVLPAGFNEPVAFSSQPTNAFAVVGQSASFSASVTGTPPYLFQWYRNGAIIGNATNATYTTPLVQGSDEGAQFTVVAGNDLNSITSAPPALLQIVSPPSFTTQPQSLTVTNGDAAGFTAVASSVTPPVYQWRRNGTNLPGATSAALAIGAASVADSGSYDVIASNAGGSATSVVATLTVVMFDFGDAPNVGYPVVKANNGARHVIAPGIFLGTAIDGEVDGLPGAAALGDDTTGVADEDGVIFLNSLRIGQTTSVQVVASTGGVLNAWLDWDRNNSWAGEQIFTNVVLVAGTNSLSLAVPGTAVAGTSYARFRFATAGALSADGPAADGEVEDYAVTIFSVADLRLTASDAPDPVGVGSNLTYAITVTNTGPLAASDVVVSNRLPANVTFVSASASAGSCTQNEGVVRCELGSMTNGGVAIVAIVVQPTLPGALTNSVNVTSAASDSALADNSATVVTTVLEPPVVTSQPSSAIAASGTTATLSVVASGAAPLSYQWRFNGADLPGRTNATLSITNVQPSESGSYSVLITNPVGATLSSSATLTVIVPPSIGASPLSSTNFAGSDVTLSVSALGDSPLVYRWYFNATNLLAGASGSTLTLSSIQSSNAGSYRVTVSNSVAVATSAVAVVTVIEADFGDAPDGYPTALATNGAWHRLVTGIHLGTAIDFEPDATINLVGTGDDLSGADDEDGVVFAGPLRTTQNANVAVVASTNGLLNAWIDFNRNGSWAEAGEQVFTNRTLVAGTNNLTFPVPLGAVAGQSFARFRFSTASGLTFTGEAFDGEVEDHPVTIEALADLGIVSVQQINPIAVGSNQVYTIAISNAGPATATGVALTDMLPPGMTFVSATPSQGSCTHSAGIVSCPLGVLAANGSAQVVIVAIPNGADSLTNAISIGGGTTDLNAGNNSTNIVAVAALPPEITSQPQSLSVTNGDTAVFTATASGSGPLRYQWAREQVDLAGATNATLTVTNAQAANAGAYTVRVSNDVGNVLSAAATLTVLGPATITTQPQGQTVLSGTNVTLSVGATGTAPLMYQWEFNGVDLSGQTGPSLVLNNVQTNQTGTYRVRVSNVIRTVTSSPATLTVLMVPVFVTQPSSMTNYFASTAVLTALAGGTQPLRYQWYFNTTNRLNNETNTLLTLTNLQVSQAGNYSVVASNVAGVTTSAVAVLSVYLVDYGDAPEAQGYPTTLAFNGARHRVLPGVRLGPQLDSETNGLPNVTATGDDFSGVDDEDGITLPGSLLLGQTMNVPVVASTNGFLDAWIDFNADGAWTDSGEQILTSRPLVAGTNIVGLPIASTALLTNTFARFRFSTVGGLSYDGFAPDGEVEDYSVIIRSAIDLGVTLVDSVDPVPAPGVLSYAMVLTNRGPSVATGVWLTNNLPTSFNVLSFTNSRGSCTVSSGRVLCNVGTLTPGQSMTLDVTVTAPVAGNFIARAAATASEAEANPADNTAVQPTSIIVPAREFTNLVEIVLADATASGPGPGNPYPSTIAVSGLTGTVYKVTATLNNVSHGFAGDLDVLLVGPRGQSVLLMSDAAGAFVLSGTTLTFDDDAGISLPTSGVISSTSYRPTAYDPTTDLFPPPAPTAPFGTNLSVFAGTDPNGVWSLYVIDDEVNDTGVIGAGWRLNISTADPMADLAVSGTDSADPVAVNSNLVYTITVTNRGPSAASGIVLSNRIPTGVTYVSAVPSQGSCVQQSGLVTCQLSNLPPAGMATVAVNVVPLSIGRYTNTATVTSPLVDFVTSNNVVAVDSTARFPVDVLVAQTASTNLVVLGQQLTYTLNVTNRGPNVAPNVRLVNPLPANVSFISVNSAQASCTNDAGTIRCTAATLASGARAQVTLVVQPAAIGTITNVASVSSDEAEILPANNVSSLSTLVNVVADVGLSSVVHAPEPVAISNVVTLSIVTTNLGPSAANGVELQAALPAGMSFISGSPQQGSCTNDSGVVRCSLGSLPVNGTNLVTLALRPNELGRLTNVISVTSASFDTSGSNNSWTNVVTVEQPPFLVTEPANVTVTNGGSVTFSAVAGGSPVLTYQWQLNETNLAGATGSILNLSNVAYAARGAYRVRIANNVGIAFSASANLTVLVPPSISDLTNRVVPEDSTVSMPFTIGDVDSGVSQLVLAVTSSNEGLLPTNRISLTGAGAAWTVAFSPVPNAFGTATVSVIVRDADGLTVADSFEVTVTPVNDAPTLGVITNQTMLEDGLLELNLTVDDVDSALPDLRFTVMSSNPALLASTNITFSGTGTSRVMTLRPATNESGTATITLGLSDTNGAATTNEFVVMVLTVNDAPTLAPLANRVLNQGAGQQVVQFTNITSGATNEVQTLTVTAVSSDPTVVPHPLVTYTSPGQGGHLTFAPLLNTNATVTITVTVDDGGETNRTVSQSFNVTLRVLAAPVISGITWTNGIAWITFGSEAGLTCVVEHKDSVTAPLWSSLPSQVTTGSVTTVTDPSATTSNRVYRVRLQ